MSTTMRVFLEGCKDEDVAWFVVEAFVDEV